MSRSFKHTVVAVDHDAHRSSDKKDKKTAHKSLRVHFRTTLSAANDLEAFQFDEHNYAHSEKETFAKSSKHLENVNVGVSQQTGHIHIKEYTDKTKDERSVHKLVGK